MSTKIYNAYKFKENLSTEELNNTINLWRKMCKTIVEKEYAKIILRKYTSLIDMKLIYGDKKINELLELNKEKPNMIQILTALKNEKYRELLFYIHMYYSDIINKESQSHIKNILTCEMTIHPLKNKTIFMLFGNQNLINMIEQQDIVKDYHYQNQTDKPDEISDKEWDERCMDWNDAIGPDYIPINHGLSATIINKNDDEFSFLNQYTKVNGISEDLFPTIKQRIQSVLDMSEPPDAPNTNKYSEWSKYTKSETYITWKSEKTKEFLSILPKNMTELFKEQCSK